MAHRPAPSATSSTLDARAARSSNALRNALLGLLERKPLDQISIREIASEAGVSYATFFRHHPTMRALLDHIAADQINRLVELTMPVLDSADTHAAVVALCEYVDAHRALWTTLLTGGAAGAMREELLRISREIALERAPTDGWLPLELAVACSVSQIVATLSWWLAQTPVTSTIEEVSSILDRLLSSVDVLMAK